MMIRAIDRRNHNNYAVNASLHGIKVPLRVNQETPQVSAPELTPEEKSYMEKVMSQGQQRVRARYV